jgi:hypothetical protein
LRTDSKPAYENEIVYPNESAKNAGRMVRLTPDRLAEPDTSGFQPVRAVRDRKEIVVSVDPFHSDIARTGYKPVPR